MAATTLKDKTPTARKEHRCMFCGGTIPQGTKYKRYTLVYEGDVYDWINHIECDKAANLLDMYSEYEDGLDDNGFRESIWDYVMTYYRDEEIDDIPENIAKMSYHELVKMVVEDYDKPFIKRQRLNNLLKDYEWREKCHRGLTPYETKRVESIKNELRLIDE